MPILNVNTPDIVNKRSLRIKEPTTTMPNRKSKVCDIKNTSTTVPKNSKDWFKKPFPVQSQNTSTYTKTSEFQDVKEHYEDYSNIHLTSIPFLSIADRVKLRKTRNSVTPVYTTSEISRKKLRSIKSEYLDTPHIVHTRISRSSKLNTYCNNPRKQRLKKIYTPNCVKMNAKNTSIAVSSKPNDLLKIPFSIKNENSSIPHVFLTINSEQNVLYENSPLLPHIATTPLIKNEEVCQVKNCSTKFSKNVCLQKTINSTIKTVNLQHGLNGNQMITMPKEPSVKIISKTSRSHNNGVYVLIFYYFFIFINANLFLF